MFTRTWTVALLAGALTFAIAEDVSAGTRHHGRSSRPIFGRSGCRYVAPTYTAPPATGFSYRSYYSAPAAPIYVAPAPAPSRTPTYMLPKMDPRKHSGGR